MGPSTHASWATSPASSITRTKAGRTSSLAPFSQKGSTRSASMPPGTSKGRTNYSSTMTGKGSFTRITKTSTPSSRIRKGARHDLYGVIINQAPLFSANLMIHQNVITSFNNHCSVTTFLTSLAGISSCSAAGEKALFATPVPGTFCPFAVIRAASCALYLK